MPTMPASGFKKTNPQDVRIKVQLTAELAAAVEKRAKDCGLSQSAYLRGLAEHDLAKGPAVKPKSNRNLMLHHAEVHALAMQVKKLGTNVNQLAKQANAGMVPISRAEVTYLLNQHQTLMSAAIAYVERVLK